MTKTKNKSTNLNSKQKNTPWYQRAWAITIFVVLGIACIVALIIFVVKPGQTNTQEDKTSSSIGNDKNPTTDTPIKNNQTTDDEEGPEKTIQYEAENPNRLNELSGFITSALQDDTNLYINAMIAQYLEADATCSSTLKGTNTDFTYTSTVRALPDVTTSNCEEFIVPITNLVPDYYQITIDLSSAEKQGIITGGVQVPER